MRLGGRRDPGPADGAPLVNPWAAAAIQPAGDRTEDILPVPGPWRYEERSRGAARYGRWAVWGAVGLLAAGGLRSAVWPPAAPVMRAATAAPFTHADAGYPVQEAQQVAARWAWAYLTWDGDRPQDRAAALAVDMPPGTDTTLGWDGHGHQAVSVVVPGAVDSGTAGRATVMVDVLVAAGGWVDLDVPVRAAGGRVTVTGEPGIVGLPASGPGVGPPPSDGDGDDVFATATEPVVGAFFEALASGDAAAVAAPGASINVLPSGMAFGGLLDWSADPGGGDDRWGTAVVRWSWSGARVEETYRVRLTRVTAAHAQRWQVSGLHGGLSTGRS